MILLVLALLVITGCNSAGSYQDESKGRDGSTFATTSESEDRTSANEDSEEADDVFSGSQTDELTEPDSRSEAALSYKGYECTLDCSGHEAGYNWAERKGIASVDDCGGNSQSFIEGCKSYVEETYDDQDEDYGSDDPEYYDEEQF